jgi:formylglycine-generating enzyme required for sulfatase activity
MRHALLAAIVLVAALPGCGSSRLGSRPAPLGSRACAPEMLLIEAGDKRFCLDRTEVTVASHASCVADGACERTPNVAAAGWFSTPREPAFWGSYCNAGRPDRAEHPMNCVTWSEAATHCRWRGARLPTNAEWALAAFGTDGRKFAWGNAPPDATRLNGCGQECREELGQRGLPWGGMAHRDAWPSTSPVGSFPAGASAFGLLDMEGNVWEWTTDDGPGEGDGRPYRGRGWSEAEGSLFEVSAPQGRSTPIMRVPDLGFRCASDAT